MSHDRQDGVVHCPIVGFDACRDSHFTPRADLKSGEWKAWLVDARRPDEVLFYLPGRAAEAVKG